MRPERCAVITDEQGKPAQVRWRGQDYRVTHITRTYCTMSADRLALHQHWLLESGPLKLHLYATEYGSGGAAEKLWWMGAIRDDRPGARRLDLNLKHP